MHPLWFYKYQYDNRVRSTQNVFSLPFAAILVNCAPSGEMYKYCTPHIIPENSENFLIHRCNYILLSQVYCVWQIVKTPTVIRKNPVYIYIYIYTHTHTHIHTGLSFLIIPYIYILYIYTGLLKMIVGVLTTCHTQYTWDSSICIFLFNRTTLQVFVTYLTGALYVHPLWFYKHY